MAKISPLFFKIFPLSFLLHWQVRTSVVQGVHCQVDSFSAEFFWEAHLLQSPLSVLLDRSTCDDDDGCDEVTTEMDEVSEYSMICQDQQLVRLQYMQMHTGHFGTAAACWWIFHLRRAYIVASCGFLAIRFNFCLSVEFTVSVTLASTPPTFFAVVNEAILLSMFSLIGASQSSGSTHSSSLQLELRNLFVLSFFLCHGLSAMAFFFTSTGFVTIGSLILSQVLCQNLRHHHPNPPRHPNHRRSNHRPT